MSIFKQVPSDGQKGKVSYNSGIVTGIVNLAVSEVEGVELLAGKKKGLKLYFEKDGIYADISVKVDYGYNVPDVAFKIQETLISWVITWRNKIKGRKDFPSFSTRGNIKFFTGF